MGSELRRLVRGWTLFASFIRPCRGLACLLSIVSVQSLFVTAALVGISVLPYRDVHIKSSLRLPALTTNLRHSRHRRFHL